MRSMVEGETQAAAEAGARPFRHRLIPLRPRSAGPHLPAGDGKGFGASALMSWGPRGCRYQDCP